MSQGPAASRRILVVCTGNICRSPFIERLLRLHLSSTGIEVASAGTGALVGHPMDPLAAELLEALGADPAGHEARQLTPELIDTADLVLTATRRHRGDVVVMSAKALPYTFAVRDFADLVRGTTPDGPQATVANGLTGLVASVAARRGLLPTRAAQDVDIIDPYGRSIRVFQQMAEQVTAVLPDVARALRG